MFVFALRALVLNLFEHADRFDFAALYGQPPTQAKAIVDALRVVFRAPAFPGKANSWNADILTFHFPTVFGFFARLGVRAANFLTTGVARLHAGVTFSSRHRGCQQEAQ